MGRTDGSKKTRVHVRKVFRTLHGNPGWSDFGIIKENKPVSATKIDSNHDKAESSSVCYNKAREYEAKKDYKNAMVWYQKACDQENIMAMLALAKIYHKGLGTEKNDIEAKSLYERAVKISDNKNNTYEYREVCREYGMFLLITGKETHDASLGFSMICRAAENGDDEAQYQAAKCYKEGHGTAPDIVNARRMLEKAFANGNAKAKKEMRNYFTWY